MFDTQLKSTTLTSQRNRLEQMNHMKSISLSEGFSNSELIQLLSIGMDDSSCAPPDPHFSQNTSGIPAGLKAKYEQRSGVSMDDVSVHYNSDKPVQYGALAYTQGNDVYLGPDQEQHLGHELGHVIQQKQGRVPVTGSVGGAPLNDDPALEQEADSFLSGNSPVQHITAGSPPDSGAPIQRLRINLSGDGKNGDPAICHLQYYNIPTGGDRLAVPNGNHEEVKKTVAAFQDELGINEDIVFEGHGVLLCPEGPTMALQNFFAKELAKMAAGIKKPDNWKGKIILFGCCAGGIAPQVAEEYYKITKTSVTVVGPKEEITIVSHPLYLPQSLFGFKDPKRLETLESEPNFQFLKKMCLSIQSLWNNLVYLFHTLTNPSVELEQKAPAVWDFTIFHLIPSLEDINGMKTNPPDGFWEHYPNLNLNLQMFYDKLRLISYKLLDFADNVSSSKTNDQIIQSQIFPITHLLNQMEDPFSKICSETFQKYVATLKSRLDFDDKEMMISTTYVPQNKDIEPPASKRSPQFRDDTKENHNPLISSRLFEVPELSGPSNSPAE